MNQQKIESLWGHLHWLTVLAQQGSFTAAAARLGVSKAAMSQRVAELERVAGVALVQRTTRSVRLTEAGQRLVDDTRASFDHIAQTFAEVSDQAAQPRGLLRVTAPVALARQQLVPRLADFLHQYPDIRIELDMSDRLVSLATEGFDLAIRHIASPPDTHVAWLLCHTRSVLVASKAYLRRHGTPLMPIDLVQHHCLHYPRVHETATWTFEGIRGLHLGQRTTLPVRGPLTANNSEALRDAAVAGLGIALLPDFSAQAALQAGKVVQVLSDWQPQGAFAGHLYAIRPYSAHVPRAVSVLVAYLRDRLTAGFADGLVPAADVTP
jgi:DNA-binding transcriptional LysR family regulator